MLRTAALAVALACMFPLSGAHAQFLPPASLPLPPEALSELQKLQLTPSQRLHLLQLAARARAEAQRLRADQESMLAQAAAALEQQNADLHALAAQQQAITDARIAGLRQLRDELLSFYDSLDRSQQADVQRWLLVQLERIDRARAAFATLRSWFAEG